MRIAEPLKRLAWEMCPPLLMPVVRRAYRSLVAFLPPERVVSSPEELDAELARFAAVMESSSYDEAIGAMARLRWCAPPRELPGDPDSPEYREAQMALYRRISGRSHYATESCEATPLTEHNLLFPAPYGTHDCRAVGEHLIGLGYLIRALDLPRGGRVLEFGPGYGKATIEMAQMGLDVTAVDVNPPFLDLIERRCRALGRAVRTEPAGMLDYRPEARFDRVLFSACFHHCDDHQRMVGQLDGLVAEGGAVVFAHEPIEDFFPVPWGLRLDGQSLWAIRRHGWLELGFRTSYFLGLMRRHGWRCEVIVPPQLRQHSVIVARRA